MGNIVIVLNIQPFLTMILYITILKANVLDTYRVFKNELWYGYWEKPHPHNLVLIQMTELCRQLCWCLQTADITTKIIIIIIILIFGLRIHVIVN